MPRYRVTLTRTSNEIIEADNPFMAALAARDRFGDGVEIADVTPAVGRPPAKTAKARRPAKKATKKRRPMSAETRAKLAQNLAKARAARAAKRRTAKKASATRKKRTARKR
jgi:hypothetical protein